MDIEELFMAFCFVVVTVLIVAGAIVTTVLLDQYKTNKIAKENCKLLRKNGNVVKVEYLNVYGLQWGDCYVKTGEQYVPYDRFWSKPEVN